MRSRRALPALFLVLLRQASLSQSVVSGVTGKPHRATAAILLESSSVHANSGNEEVYVADLKFSVQKEAQLAKIVDRYPGTAAHRPVSPGPEPAPTRTRYTRSGLRQTGNQISLPSNKQGEFAPEVRQRLQERGAEVLRAFCSITIRRPGHALIQLPANYNRSWSA